MHSTIATFSMMFHILSLLFHSYIVISVSLDVPHVIVPETSRLPASAVGLIINIEDPYSVKVGDAYASARSIPANNIVRVNFTSGLGVLSNASFAPVKAAVDAALPPSVQVLALTWLWPYAVGCMSVTSAFALGFDPVKYCSTPCNPTAPSPYYNSSSTAPFSDFGLRPAMLLAGWTEDLALAMITAGVASDSTHPYGNGYLFRTGDAARSVRYPEFIAVVAAMSPGQLNLTYEDCSDNGCAVSPAGWITNTTDVMYYFESIASVPNLDTNTFRPGAVGDVLTSYAGILTNTSGQMPCINFTAAGAIGSYGTVEEPCNFVENFTDPSIFIPRYYAGETLIEAYWKSVAQPGEGLFVGEPLACPYCVSKTSKGGGEPTALAVRATAPLTGIIVTAEHLPPGHYRLWACATMPGGDACRPIEELAASATVTAAGGHSALFHIQEEDTIIEGGIAAAALLEVRRGDAPALSSGGEGQTHRIEQHHWRASAMS